MIQDFSRKRKLIFLVIAALVLSGGPVFSAKKKNVKKVEEPEQITSLAKVEAKKYTYFSLVDPQILSDVETGSPQTLKRAVLALRKADVEYSENEKVLLAVASNIIQMVYPTERMDWEIPEIAVDTPYLGAIQSAKKSIYDRSTGNVDFLTLLLPSLVLTKTEEITDYYEESKKALEEALLLRPDSVLANYLYGLLLQKNKEYKEAEVYFEKASLYAPDCFQVSYACSEVLYNLKQYRKAFNTSVLLLDKYPLNQDLLKICALTAYELANYNAAEEYSARILQQNPNNLEALLFRVKTLLAKKDYIHAASLLDVYSRQDSVSKDYLVLRSQLQYDWSKNINAAVNTIENALKLYPGDMNILLFAARLSNSALVKINGKTSDEYADKVLQIDPENEEALKYAVEGLERKKEFEKAYELSKKILQADEVSDASVFSHIKLCLSLKKYDEAWNYISPLYKSKSDDEEVIQIYITALDETDRDNQALQLINQLLPTSNSSLKSFLYYRKSLLEYGEPEKLSSLRSSLIANPRNSDSLYQLYKIYYDKKDFRKAQYYLKQVVSLNPNDEDMHRLNDELTLLNN